MQGEDSHEEKKYARQVQKDRKNHYLPLVVFLLLIIIIGFPFIYFQGKNDSKELINQKNNTIAELKGIIKERDTRIQNLESKVTENNTTIINLKLQIQNLEDKIIILENTIVEKESDISDLQEENRNLKNNVIIYIAISVASWTFIWELLKWAIKRLLKWINDKYRSSKKKDSDGGHSTAHNDTTRQSASLSNSESKNEKKLDLSRYME